MIDFHSHILHAIDDGASSLDAALAIARTALDDGITTMVATPHSPLSPSGRNYTVAYVRQQLTELQQALALAALPLQVVAGTELYYHPDLVQHLESGIVLPCGRHRAVLLECPGSYLPTGFEDLVFALQVAEYRVVLAHPERIKPVQKQPDLLLPLVERGMLTQLTAASLLGGYGTKLKKVSETLLTSGLVHLLASDTHGSSKRNLRQPRLSGAYERAAELIGPEAARALVYDTPAALLNGSEPDLPPPQSVRTRRSIWPLSSRSQ